MTIEMQDLINDVGELVSFPEVYHRINELIKTDEYTVNDVARLISQDPSFTLRLLKLANSPFYGVSREIDSVSRAISVLGMNTVQELVLSTSASKILEGIPNTLFVMDDFWHHSIYCGLMAQHLAQACHKIESDFAFVGGLLHDIGQLVYFNKAPGLAKVVLELIMEPGKNLQMHEAEQKVFGFDHMQLGGKLLRSWHLPVRLQECVEFHHAPEKAEHYPIEVAVVHIANWLTYVIEIDMPIEEVVTNISTQAWEVTGLSPEIIEETLETAKTSLGEMREMLGLK